MIDMIACIALYTGLAVAPPPRRVEFVSPVVIQQHEGAQAAGGAYFGNGVILWSFAADSMLAHELTHYLQDRAGLDFRSPASERQARWLQINYQKLCGRDARAR